MSNQTPVEASPASTEPMNYFMFTTEVVFVRKGQRAAIKINVLFTAAQPRIDRYSLGKVQQLAQIRFLQSQEKPEQFHVRDVVILNISHLGVMSELEFNAEFLTDQALDEASQPIEVESQEDHQPVDLFSFKETA